MNLHVVASLTQIGTFLALVGGMFLALGKGARWLSRFIDAAESNTTATNDLTAELTMLTRSTDDNTSKLATLTTATDGNTEHLTLLDERVETIESKVEQWDNRS